MWDVLLYGKSTTGLLIIIFYYYIIFYCPVILLKRCCVLSSCSGSLSICACICMCMYDVLWLTGVPPRVNFPDFWDRLRINEKMFWFFFFNFFAKQQIEHTLDLESAPERCCLVTFIFYSDAAVALPHSVFIKQVVLANKVSLYLD